MKRALVFFLLITFSAVLFTRQPLQSQNVGEKFYVLVDINCDDESLKNLIESHIKRELRALHDVSVDTPGDLPYMIRVMGQEIKFKSGEKAGNVSLGTLFLRPYLFGDIGPYLSDISAFLQDVSDSKIPTVYYEPQLSLADISQKIV